MLELNRLFPIDKKFFGLLSCYELHVTYVYIDNDAIRVNYTITPPLPSVSEGLPIITWGGYARDDRGEDYESAGGAFGLSPDKTHTDGVLSFVPFPHSDILRLDILRLDITMVSGGLDPGKEYSFSVSF